MELIINSWCAFDTVLRRAVQLHNEDADIRRVQKSLEQAVFLLDVIANEMQCTGIRDFGDELPSMADMRMRLREVQFRVLPMSVGKQAVTQQHV